MTKGSKNWHKKNGKKEEIVNRVKYNKNWQKLVKITDNDRNLSKEVKETTSASKFFLKRVKIDRRK